MELTPAGTKKIVLWVLENKRATFLAVSSFWRCHSTRHRLNIASEHKWRPCVPTFLWASNRDILYKCQWHPLRLVGALVIKPRLEKHWVQTLQYREMVTLWQHYWLETMIRIFGNNLVSLKMYSLNTLFNSGHYGREKEKNTPDENASCH